MHIMDTRAPSETNIETLTSFLPIDLCLIEKCRLSDNDNGVSVKTTQVTRLGCGIRDGNRIFHSFHGTDELGWSV